MDLRAQFHNITDNIKAETVLSVTN